MSYCRQFSLSAWDGDGRQGSPGINSFKSSLNSNECFYVPWGPGIFKTNVIQKKIESNSIDFYVADGLMAKLLLHNTAIPRKVH